MLGTEGVEIGLYQFLNGLYTPRDIYLVCDNSLFPCLRKTGQKAYRWRGSHSSKLHSGGYQSTEDGIRRSREQTLQAHSKATRTSKFLRHSRVVKLHISCVSTVGHSPVFLPVLKTRESGACSLGLQIAQGTSRSYVAYLRAQTK